MATQATQKRWLTAANGKLSKADLSIVMRKEAAWELLSPETRQRLYTLLPVAPEGRPHNPDVHPLKTTYQKRIYDELTAWQRDLCDGKETKKWRDEAMQAGLDRSLGLWDDWKEAHREDNWGARQDENQEPKDANEELDGEDDEMKDGRREIPDSEDEIEVKGRA